ncbi:hypothetical protein ABJ829_004820, partial [Escherichia coli]
MEPLTISAAALGIVATNKMVETFSESLTKSTYELLNSVVSQKWKHGTDNAKVLIEQILKKDTFTHYF